MQAIFNSQSEIFTWIILPILIFLARICDVSIGTVRIVYVSKGFKLLASILGFIEVSIWIMAMSQIMKHLNNPLCFLAYGAGFATGNYIGITIEEKLSIGTVIIRIIPRDNATELIAFLKSQNIGLTIVDGEGSYGKVKVIFSVIQRQEIDNVINNINKYTPSAFYSIEDVKAVKEGIFKESRGGLSLKSLSFWSKRK